VAKIKICIEEEIVSQQQASFTVTVKPAAGGGGGGGGIVITPANGALPDEQVGVLVVGDKLATVKGGVAPYSYKFSGQPSGMAFDEKDNGDGSFDVVTLGTPDVGDDDPTKTPYTIVMTVSDSANPPATASSRVNVNR
jgi:hypothetical protein